MGSEYYTEETNFILKDIALGIDDMKSLLGLILTELRKKRKG